MPRLPIKIDKGWMPDLLPDDVAAAGGLVTATNILPISGAYYPAKAMSAYNDNAVSGTPIRGTYIQSSTDGNNYNFVGTTTKLYRFDKSSMTDLTRASGGDYSATFWDFAPYGNWLIATDYADAPQVKKSIEDGTIKFVALGGTPPNAKYCLMDHGHLILAYLNYGSVVYPKQIMWSGQELPEAIDYNNPTDLTTGADYQEFPEMDGVITGLAKVGGGWALFSENSITLAYYIGGSYTFRFDANAIKNVGCFYPSSLISIGDRVFFWSKDSIWELSSAGIREVGQHVKRNLFATLDITQSAKIKAWSEPSNSLIRWVYITSSAANPDKVLTYNYMDGRITIQNYSCYTAMQGVTGGDVIDNLTSANGYPVINSMNSLINSYNAGNNLDTVMFGTDGKAKTLAGSNLTAEIETGEIGDPEAVSMVTKAYIPVEGLTGTSVVTPKHRYSVVDSQTSGGTSSIKTDGTADLRVSDRRHALNIQVTNFARLGNTINLDVKPAGRR